MRRFYDTAQTCPRGEATGDATEGSHEHRTMTLGDTSSRTAAANARGFHVRGAGVDRVFFRGLA